MRTVKKETSTDYYEILQLSSTADQEMIERAYRLLAKRYHPDNIDTGDRGKFAELMEAYDVLSDSEKRVAYDANHKADNVPQDNFFFNVPQSDDSDAETRLYQAILLILYIARRKDVMKPGVGGFQLEKLLGLPEKELEFYIWYLKEKRWIEHTETGGFAITASGVDAVIEKNIILRKDRLLPYADESSFNCAEPEERQPSERAVFYWSHRGVDRRADDSKLAVYPRAGNDYASDNGSLGPGKDVNWGRCSKRQTNLSQRCDRKRAVEPAGPASRQDYRHADRWARLYLWAG